MPDVKLAYVCDPDEARAAKAPVTTAGPGEVVELSPFQVSAAADRGYLAANTLSGTRLNSKLEDLGSSITVITKQQMEDLALLDINDVFRYEASTEGTDNFTTFNRNRSGGVNDQVQSDPSRANRVRGVTAAEVMSRHDLVLKGTRVLDAATGTILEEWGPSRSGA